MRKAMEMHMRLLNRWKKKIDMLKKKFKVMVILDEYVSFMIIIFFISRNRLKLIFYEQI